VIEKPALPSNWAWGQHVVREAAAKQLEFEGYVRKDSQSGENFVTKFVPAWTWAQGVRFFGSNWNLWRSVGPERQDIRHPPTNARIHAALERDGKAAAAAGEYARFSERGLCLPLLVVGDVRAIRNLIRAMEMSVPVRSSHLRCCEGRVKTSLDLKAVAQQPPCLV